MKFILSHKTPRKSSLVAYIKHRESVILLESIIDLKVSIVLNNRLRHPGKYILCVIHYVVNKKKRYKSDLSLLFTHLPVSVVFKIWK